MFKCRLTKKMHKKGVNEFGRPKLEKNTHCFGRPKSFTPFMCNPQNEIGFKRTTHVLQKGTR